MARFLPAQEFQSASSPIQLLPLRFERTGTGRYLVSNIVGEFFSLSGDEFERLVELQLAPGDELYEKAYASHVITRAGQTAQLQLLATRLRSRMAFLREPSALHLFVVTLRCEHSCPYCQVSRQSSVDQDRVSRWRATPELPADREDRRSRQDRRASGWKGTSIRHRVELGAAQR